MLKRMTTVEVDFRYGGQLGEAALLALGRMREVYGVRGVSVDAQAGVLRVEYDATRLQADAVTALARCAGFEMRPQM